jgi:PleD family two-component response regulator
MQIPGLNVVSPAISAMPVLPLPRLSLAGIHALIVDDDTDTLDFLSFLLEQSGASVTTAATVAEALQTLEQSRPNILLSDIGMPEMAVTISFAPFAPASRDKRYPRSPSPPTLEN